MNAVDENINVVPKLYPIAKFERGRREEYSLSILKISMKKTEAINWKLAPKIIA